LTSSRARNPPLAKQNRDTGKKAEECDRREERPSSFSFSEPELGAGDDTESDAHVMDDTWFPNKFTAAQQGLSAIEVWAFYAHGALIDAQWTTNVRRARLFRSPQPEDRLHLPLMIRRRRSNPLSFYPKTSSLAFAGRQSVKQYGYGKGRRERSSAVTP
jgi:hypothetical protein